MEFEKCAIMSGFHRSGHNWSWKLRKAIRPLFADPVTYGRTIIVYGRTNASTEILAASYMESVDMKN